MLRQPCPAVPASPPFLFCGIASCPCQAFTATPHNADICTCLHLKAQHVDLAALGASGEAVGVDLPVSVLESARGLLDRMGPRTVMLLLGEPSSQAPLVAGAHRSRS